jgi:hypothetical protein
MIAQLRHRILAHIRNSWILRWAGNLRLADAAYKFAMQLKQKLNLLKLVSQQ